MTASGSTPTSTATRTICSNRRWPSSRTSGCGCRTSARIWWPTPAARAARCSASTATPASRRTSRRTRRWRASTSATSGRRRRTRSGLYLHVEPRNVFAGGGIWHADTKTAHAIRRQIVKDPDGWSDAKRGIELAQGESLKRVPPAFDKEHPHADDLRAQGLRGHPALHPEEVDDDRLPRPATRRRASPSRRSCASCAARSAWRTEHEFSKDRGRTLLTRRVRAARFAGDRRQGDGDDLDGELGPAHHAPDAAQDRWLARRRAHPGHDRRRSGLRAAELRPLPVRARRGLGRPDAEGHGAVDAARARSADRRRRPAC